MPTFNRVILEDDKDIRTVWVEYVSSDPDRYNFLLTYTAPFDFDCFYFFADRNMTIDEIDYFEGDGPALAYLEEHFDTVYSAAMKLKIKCDL